MYQVLCIRRCVSGAIRQMLCIRCYDLGSMYQMICVRCYITGAIHICIRCYVTDATSVMCSLRPRRDRPDFRHFLLLKSYAAQDNSALLCLDIAVKLDILVLH